MTFEEDINKEQNIINNLINSRNNFVTPRRSINYQNNYLRSGTRGITRNVLLNKLSRRKIDKQISLSNNKIKSLREQIIKP